MARLSNYDVGLQVLARKCRNEGPKSAACDAASFGEAAICELGAREAGRRARISSSRRGIPKTAETQAKIRDGVTKMWARRRELATEA